MLLLYIDSVNILNFINYQVLMKQKKPPKVFISYSHDDIEHKEWVLNLAYKMCNYYIDPIIDQWSLETW